MNVITTTPQPFRRTPRLLAAVAAVAFAVLAPRAARAGFTPVHDTGLEPAHRQILDTLYGGDFAADGVDFTNGPVTAERVPDSVGGGAGQPLDALSDVAGDASDQVWRDAVITTRARARFASYEQSLGIYLGASGDSFRPLLNVVGHGFDVSGASAPVDLRGQTWRWVRGGPAGPFSSQDADNPGAADQMVAYQVRGLGDGGTTKTWLLLFEDLPSGGDHDLNDMVIEVKATPAVVGGVQAIPLPPAAWTGAGVLAGLAALRIGRGARRRA